MKRAKCILASFLLFLASAAQETPRLPDTVAGQRVAAYLRAFNSGDDTLMRGFIENNVAAAALARRGAEQRLEVYRQMRSEMESLELRRVLDARADQITILVRTRRGSWFEFGFEFEAGPPHKLIGIRVEDSDPAAEEVRPAERDLTEAQMLLALEQIMEGLAKTDEFSGVVLVAKDDRTIFKKAYGLASIEHGVPNRPETRFNLGSINKVFTQIAIGQLAEHGKLSLNDTIAKHLPDYPNREAAEKVTIRHLLEMTSGIGDFFNQKYRATPKDRLRTIGDYLPLFAAEPLAFEPGSKRQYSNGGYIVLGAIIEKATGRSYYDYVRDHIFKPLGMENTDSYEADTVVPNIASGYTRGEQREGAKRNNIYTRPARGSSAGGGYSTADDLLRFALALRARKLPGARAVLGEQGGIGVAGGAPGINAALEADFATGYTIIVLSNYDPPAAGNVARQIRGLIARLSR